MEYSYHYRSYKRDICAYGDISWKDNTYIASLKLNVSLMTQNNTNVKQILGVKCLNEFNLVYFYLFQNCWKQGKSIKTQTPIHLKLQCLLPYNQQALIFRLNYST
jgi:hypothetical protein